MAAMFKTVLANTCFNACFTCIIVKMTRPQDDMWKYILSPGCQKRKTCAS